MPFQASKAVQHPGFVEVPRQGLLSGYPADGAQHGRPTRTLQGGRLPSIGGGVADCASAAPNCYCLGRRNGVPQAQRTFPLTSPAL